MSKATMKNCSKHFFIIFLVLKSISVSSYLSYFFIILLVNFTLRGKLLITSCDVINEWISLVEKIFIRETITSLNKLTFDGCNNFITITVEIFYQNYSSVINVILYNKEKPLLILYPLGNPDVSGYTLPKTLTSLKV